MFKEAETGVVYWPVIMLASNANSELREVTVHVGYKIFERAELHAAQRAAMDRAAETARKLSASGGRSVDEIMTAVSANDDAADADHVMLMERVVGWRAGTDAETGAAIELAEFSKAALSKALSREYLFNALRNGLYHASRGAVQKNSLPGHAGTPAPAQA